MEYQILKKLYYQDKDKYNALCKQRKEAEFTFTLPFKIHDNDAFFCLCPEIYSITCTIMELDKTIDRLRSKLPSAALDQFTKKCLIDEMKLTNDMEGVYSTRKELSEAVDKVAQNAKGKKTRFYGLAKKYSLLNREALSLKSCSDIRQLYNELVLPEVIEEDPKNNPDGTIFRKDMTEITTSTGNVVHHGVYPESKIIELMEKALGVLNNEKLPCLIKIPLFHYLFGYIHPFYDGNGRTSRFISSYLLAKNFDNLIGYRLSYTIKANKKKYYDAFELCNDEKNCGDLTPFIITFLSIVLESFVNLHEALRSRINTLNHSWKLMKGLDLFSDNAQDEFCFVLLQGALFSEGGISQKELCSFFEQSPSSITKRIAKVNKTGLLKKVRDGRSMLYSIDLEKLSALTSSEKKKSPNNSNQ